MTNHHNTEGPIIIQSDLTVLLDTSSSFFEECRRSLLLFAELLKSPEYMHTYRITPISLWNAAALGMNALEIIETLKKYSRFPVPENVIYEIDFNVARFGKLTLLRSKGKQLCLNSSDKYILMEICGNETAAKFIHKKIDELNVIIKPEFRGELKRILTRMGYPVKDIAGYVEGSPLEVNLKNFSASGKPFGLRDYQSAAVEAFHREGSGDGGSGVVVLPCGAGKTCVGIGAMSKVRSETLILTTNTVAVRQWISELLDKTTLSPEDIGEYSGDRKQVRPVTVSTYQMIMWHQGYNDHYPHFAVLTDNSWGLIIYDEVHLLPAPIFRVTAQIQARRRLGLTATLIREDGLEGDVFSLIGPKRYELPWKTLEKSGFIAKANCYEIRVRMGDSQKYDYAVAKHSQKHRISSVNINKIDVIKKIIGMHGGEPTLVIGQYLDQIGDIAKVLNAPIITGRTPSKERELLYHKFKLGHIPVLVVSKVANFAIDLPDASCAIQVSGTFGSRQEEAQRLGRILRPKTDGREAHFYSLVTSDSVELEFSQNRQIFLTEQGYKYYIMDGQQFIDRMLIAAPEKKERPDLSDESGRLERI